MPHLSIRFDDSVLALIDQAAEEAGKSKSIWAREVLVRAAAGRKIQPHPQRALALQGGSNGTQTLEGCRHPRHAWKREPFKVICGIPGCGVVVKRT